MCDGCTPDPAGRGSGRGGGGGGHRGHRDEGGGAAGRDGAPPVRHRGPQPAPPAAAHRVVQGPDSGSYLQVTLGNRE